MNNRNRLNNRVNSAKKFFEILEDSRLIPRLIEMGDKHMLGVVDYIEFHKRLMELFQGHEISQTAVDASKWVLKKIESVDSAVESGTLDAWSDMDHIHDFYNNYISYETWENERKRAIRWKIFNNLLEKIEILKKMITQSTSVEMKEELKIELKEIEEKAEEMALKFATNRW